MNSFVITGPNTVTTQVFYNAAGSVFTDTGIKASLGGTTPPVICGTNSGYHSMSFRSQLLFNIYSNLITTLTNTLEK